MPKEVISTSNAPEAIGPYSQGVRAGDFIFISGQIPIDPETGAVVEGGIIVQTERVLKNIQAILEQAGATLENVLKTTVYLTDLENFADMNRIYGGFFPANSPARATVEVSRLPKDVLVEIEAIAWKVGA